MVDLAVQLRSDSVAIAQAATHRQFATDERLTTRLGPAAADRCAEDAAFHLHQLASAVHTGRTELFADYIAWVTRLLLDLGLTADDLATQLSAINDELTSRFGDDAAAAREVLAAVQADPPEPIDATTSLLATSGPGAHLARTFLGRVLGGQRHEAITSITDAVDDGMALETVYLEVLQPCLREVGRLWQTGRISVAQEHLVTAATQVAMAQLYPRVFATPRIGRTAVVASIGGELHEIGGRMVADLFELRGWTTVFAGANTPTPALVSLVAEHEPDVIALSATIGAHVPDVANTIARLRASLTVPIIAGGRAFL
ncbi:MAG: cobalamin-dependent protein, partial [Nitriliruptoraceae bacterium]